MGPEESGTGSWKAGPLTEQRGGFQDTEWRALAGAPRRQGKGSWSRGLEDTRRGEEAGIPESGASLAGEGKVGSLDAGVTGQTQ